MKLTRPSLSQLTVESSTLIFKLVGFIFFIAGLVVLYFMTERYQLSCDSTTMRCDLKTITWFNQQSKNIGKIKKAKVINTSRKKGSYNYFLKLKRKKGGIKVNKMGSPSASAIKPQVAKINAYLQDPRGVLTINPLFPIWFYILPFSFLLISSSIIVFPKKVKVLFDSNENSLIIQRKNIFSNQEKRYVLSDIKEIILQDTYSRNGRLYRIAFVFKNGDIIPLSESYDNFLESKIKTITEMSQFLNIDFNSELTARVEKQKKLALLVFVIAGIFILVSMMMVFTK